MNNKKIAIIGAGYTGLSAAKKLIEEGYEVTIYEKDKKVGGMTRTIGFEGTEIEEYYRHIFKCDKYVIDLVKELNLQDNLKWLKAKMGYYINGKKYRFGQPLTLLTFKPLSLMQKFKFGLGILKLKFIKKYEKLENINAEDWVIENCGEEVYKKIWEPLLISKFGNKKSEISMAWLWGKINLRSSSSNILTESLGYMIGSFNVLTNGLEKYLREKGCKFELGIDIKEITYTNNKKWIVNNNEFDLVLSTVAYPTTKSILKGYLNKEEEKILDSVKYTAARTMMIVLKKSLTNFYWLNIGEKDIPFGGVIEHTNLVSRDNYNNKSVVYISNYMYEDEEMYNMSKEELLKLYEPYLKNISKKFDRKGIIDYQVYDERYAQPIIEKNYSNKILPFKLKKEGLYVATMPQIYPEDRGMNYAIKIGYEVAEKIIESHKKYKL